MDQPRSGRGGKWAELDGGAPLDPLPLIRSYIWGLDLADSFEEAGGIGDAC